MTRIKLLFSVSAIILVEEVKLFKVHSRPPPRDKTSHLGRIPLSGTTEKRALPKPRQLMVPAPVLALSLSFLLGGFCAESQAGKILVYPVDGSHWLNMNVLLGKLQQRGHAITVIRSSTSWYIAEEAPHYTSITVPSSDRSVLEDPDYMASFLRRSLEISQKGERSVLAFIALQQEIFSVLCKAHRASAEMVRTILEDGRLVRKLKAERYELMLTDPGFGGGVILGSFLGLPMVFNVRWIINGEGHFAIAPSPLSYIPTIGSLVSDQMTLLNKLKNFLHYGIGLYIDHSTRPYYQGVCDQFLGSSADVYSLMQGADLWLMRVDFVFEFPRPTMPNVVYIGGFQCRPAKPLSPELEEFAQSSGEHGVVIMSLGTLFGNIAPEISEVVASAFARLPQKVIWRHVGPRPSTLANNTLLVDWLPQNDLLGHPKTRAFVTHGGTNGIYEAIYHGVPVLGLPLVFDQFDNMLRLEARGAAKVLDVTNLEVEALTKSLQDIMDEGQPYRSNMQRLSQLHHDQPLKPMDKAIFWLEFVMRHKGAAHLRTESYKMPWYAYHSIDVMAFLLGSATTVFFLIFTMLKCLCRALRSRRKVKLQ